MVSSDSMRGYNDLLILSLLSQGDSYGYEISKKIREGSQDRYLMKETTLYSAFSRLEKNDWIIAYPGEVTHGKRRTYYKISAAGRNALAAKKDEWQTIQAIVNHFLLEE
ncbi:PadR family transcriptional regulator [Enterococcus nangangensis]